MTHSPSFLMLRRCDENNSKIIVNMDDIQSISEIEHNGNNCTNIRFKHKDWNYFVQETVEEIANLLSEGTSLYHVPF